jgi:phosphoserine aminotransferase
MQEVFEGETINTPSMLALEDYLDALSWARSVGGVKGLISRADANAQAIFDWTARTPWIANLAAVPATRSNTSVCLRFVDPVITGLPADRQATFAKQVAGLLDKEGAAHDIANYRDAPPGLRIWCGSTIEMADVKALLPWIEWAYAHERLQLS